MTTSFFRPIQCLEVGSGVMAKSSALDRGVPANGSWCDPFNHVEIRTETDFALNPQPQLLSS